jgi:hypothetical protein
VWVHAFSRLGRVSPGSDGASPYHLERRSILRTNSFSSSSSFSFSICSGGNRSARVARAARFGRSLSLPPHASLYAS